MRILVVGSGGREHALSWALSKESEVFCAPGNPGIAEDVGVVPIAASDHDGLSRFARKGEIDLVVIGPEDPLLAGLADRLRADGIAVFGPNGAGANLEGSKAFSKALMVEAGIPTALHLPFDSPHPAKQYAARLFESGTGAVIKASGTALGKGAIVCDTLAEAETAIDDMLVRHTLGESGKLIVVEQRLRGPEFSLLTLISGRHFRSLPVAQDYKRAHDLDQGPNTGGMGSYSPVERVTGAVVAQTEQEVVVPLLNALREKGIDFRGMLYSGLLVHDGRPHCIEFNVRFGDPEAQCVLPTLGAGFAAALAACAAGVEIHPIEVNEVAAVTVVVASRGYPEAPQKGFEVRLPKNPSAKIFHAGTTLAEGGLVNSGGRVFGVTGVGANIVEARTKAYETAAGIQFEGAWFRSDIGAA